MNKITYSRTVNLGDFNSERIEYTVEYEAGTIDKDDVFTVVKESVMGWVETQDQKPTVTTNSQPAATPPGGEGNTSKANWCEEHDTKFFKTPKMRGYAHPMGEGEPWHNR